MEKAMLNDIEGILGKCSMEPMIIGNNKYAELFISESSGSSLVVTNFGKDLYNSMPSISMKDIFTKTPEQMGFNPVAGGYGGKIYKNKDNSFAIKSYSFREDGISQLMDMEYVRNIVRELPAVNVPRTYYASLKSLLMDYIDAPLWSEIVEDKRERNKDIWDFFYRSGALKTLSRNRVANTMDSILVKTDSNGKISELYIIDPVILK